MEVFSRYGLGPRGFEVFFVSVFGTTAYMMERFMAAFMTFVKSMETTGLMPDDDPDIKRMLINAGRVGALKSLIHPQDMALIEEYYEELKGIVDF
ncbi:MAG: hypothetical protein LBP32_04720 [Spirochaetaceae bacterium]|jgi:hypothetical protein|nr:hypothetical protein [Spirochaetaceae bacterium]